MPVGRDPNRVGRAAFTLIELLVVVTVVAVLALIISPVLGRITSQGAQTKTLSNMRQMGVALLAYAADNNYQLPNRVNGAVNGSISPKWPSVLRDYVQDLAVYGSPIPDVGGQTYKVPDPSYYLNNSSNYTCYIYNGGNDVAPYADGSPNAAPSTLPRLNTVSRPTQTILLGIPYPKTNQFYMDFVEGKGNNNEILNKKAFANGTPYIFCDGSARTLSVDAKVDNKSEPPSSGTYSDWLWLFDKSQTAIIQ